MSKRILITGGAGFVGSSIAILLKEKYPSYSIFCFDNLKRRGSELSIARLQEKEIQFIHGDIRNKEDFDQIGSDITTIIEASAEPSVLAGLNGSPDYLINTNLLGTINCLNFAHKKKTDFIFLSTSRIYPIAQIEKINFEESESRFSISNQQDIPGISTKGISENFPTNGFRSLYGATKLASELFIQEYNQFYNLKTIINRCGVIAGPWQMGKVDQGVIGLWVARHFWQQKLGYFGYNGTGKQVRDILHIHDLFRLVDFEIHNMDLVNGELFNAGGGSEVSVSLLELTKLCQDITGNRVEIDRVIESRQADIRIYITDNTRIKKCTGWEPQKNIQNIISDVYHWIKGNEKDLKPILS
jgi:CDP-paratose 2-epimerase